MQNLMRLLNLLLAAGLWSGNLSAQTQQSDEGKEPSAAPQSQELLLAELDRRRPDEHSPFFANQELAQFVNSPAGRRMIEEQGVGIYPNTAGTESVDKMFGSFFKGLVSSFRFGPPQTSKMLELKVTPGSSFTLSDRREISASLQLTNENRDLLRLYFPSGQRFDFVIRDGTGAVLEQWSNDRSFEEAEGVVMINPGEKIEYSATLSTREMEAGQTYLLEAQVSGHPEYTRSITLQPY